MIVGVPREHVPHEHRVGLTPFGVQRLASLGHTVLVESGAGEDARFADADYELAGATIIGQPEQVWSRADLICRVGSLQQPELELLREQAVVCGFHHLVVANRRTIESLRARGTTMVGYEILEDHQGRRPVLTALSEIAGKLSIQIICHLLQHEEGGRGLILGGVPGISPATVVILGAGNVGRTAARTAMALGAHVVMLDSRVEKLREAIAACGDHLVTAVATPRNLEKFTAIADALIGAVIQPGGRSPSIVTEAMVTSMKRGSVILDLAIDQGGCVETSRPTTLGEPTFTKHGIRHYCVPNITSNVPRTASRALTLSVLPILTWIAEGGIQGALHADLGLRRGIYIYQGQIVHSHLAQSIGVMAEPLEMLLGSSKRTETEGDDGELV